jgi:hypothetical protein
MTRGFTICSLQLVLLGLLNKVNMMKHIVCMGETINAYSLLVEKPDNTRLLGRPKHRYDNIRMDIREIDF